MQSNVVCYYINAPNIVTLQSNEQLCDTLRVSCKIVQTKLYHNHIAIIYYSAK